MFNNIIFKIAGKETSSENYMVVIPEEYEHFFRGFDFNDVHHFSQAVMFAACAHEGKMYGDARQMKMNEVSLKSCFK